MTLEATLIASQREMLEARGWTMDSAVAGPKAAALASLVNLAPPEPVARVTYVSHGNLLIIAGRDVERARACAARLGEDLHVTLLTTAAERGGTFANWTGRITGLTGYLGEFDATIANLRAEGQPGQASANAKFDLVLDFSAAPLFAMREPPQGYYRAPADEAALEQLTGEIREAVGEFEKPRYFHYRESLCAHQRSGIEGCNACIDVCSTQAIAADGDKVKVDPHLCMGCGACSTVCPSGAMGYQFPRPADRGAQMKQVLSAYRHAGGQDACLLFHDGEGRELLAATATSGEGLPARVIPVESWHVASTGIDILLSALAYGAGQVAVLCTGRETPEYREALRSQMELAGTIASALGRGGKRFVLIETNEAGALAATLDALAPEAAMAIPATFMLSNDKRTAVEFAVEHLAKHAPARVDEIELAHGAPWGEVVVDRQKCTMCLSCAGACPESALMDGVDQPMLKFLERNCVQCGLCEKTCPESAITLKPRLLLTPAVREARVLNETQPFHCVSCQKPFGTKQMVDAMLSRLSGHSMFAGGAALKRLQMCADCRVVDMMSNKNEVSVLKL